MLVFFSSMKPFPAEVTRAQLIKLGLPAEPFQVVRFDEPVSEAGSVSSNSGLLLGSSLTDSKRPAPGGMEVGIPQFGACTLGFNLFAWIDGQPSSARYFITNSHCFAPNEGTIGFQDGWDVKQNFLGQRIGFKAADTWWPFTPGNNVNCPTGTQYPNQNRKCRYADAALVRHELPGNSAHGQIAWPSIGTTQFTSTVTITGMDYPYQGQTVNMVGKSSGRRSGTVQNTCVTVLYLQIWGQMCQVGANYSSADGDSGAPVVVPTSSTTALALGIHWGRSGSTAYFFPLYYALDEWYSFDYPQYRALGYLDPGPLP